MQQLRLALRRMVNSIAFLPTVVGGSMILTALLHVFFMDDAWIRGTALERLAITNGDSARSVLAAVIGGMFTLVIFTYTMVMNVLSRSISNYSPRLLTLLLGEQYHQFTMGFTLGTIAYALVLYFGIDADPKSLSAALGVSVVVLLVGVSLGLYVLFIHQTSKNIHVNFLLRYSFNNTWALLEKYAQQQPHLDWTEERPELSVELHNPHPGYLSDLELRDLATWARRHERTVRLCMAPGVFVPRGAVLFQLDRPVGARAERHLRRLVRVSAEEPIRVFEVGYKHLTEVAVKAMSPALNDPSTALTVLDYLTELFRRLLTLRGGNVFSREGGTVHFRRVPAQMLLGHLYAEMAAYFKDDPVLRSATERSLDELARHAATHRTDDWVNSLETVRREVARTFAAAAP